MKIVRFVAAIVAGALVSLGLGTAVAVVHPHYTFNSHDDAVGVQSYCAYTGGNPVVVVEAELGRSPERTSNLTYDINIAYDSGGTHYSGNIYPTPDVVTPGSGATTFSDLTTAGPKGLGTSGGTLLTTATNIEVSIVRHSDSELEGYERARNISTACS